MLAFVGFALGIFAVLKLMGLGNLPGDILIRKKNFTFYFPLGTSILLSVILTVLLNLIFKRR